MLKYFIPLFAFMAISRIALAQDSAIPGTDFALLSQKEAWMRHPVIGDPSFDNFRRYDKNPVQRGTPPFNWPVNGFY